MCFVCVSFGCTWNFENCRHISSEILLFHSGMEDLYQLYGLAVWWRSWRHVIYIAQYIYHLAAGIAWLLHCDVSTKVKILEIIWIVSISHLCCTKLGCTAAGRLHVSSSCVFPCCTCIIALLFSSFLLCWRHGRYSGLFRKNPGFMTFSSCGL